MCLFTPYKKKCQRRLEEYYERNKPLHESGKSIVLEIIKKENLSTSDSQTKENIDSLSDYYTSTDNISYISTRVVNIT